MAESRWGVTQLQNVQTVGDRSWPGDRQPSDASSQWVSMGEVLDPIQYQNASGNDWQADKASAANLTAFYRLDPWGMIHFRGVIEKTDSTSQALGSPIFAMTAGLRRGGGAATQVQSFPVNLTNNAGNIVMGRVVVWGHGSTFPGHLRYAGPHFASVTSLDLSSISYLVEQA